MLWFWIFVGPAILLAILSLRGERLRAEYVAAQMAGLEEPEQRPLPPATLIVLAGDSADGLAETLPSLAAQDYPDYELVVAASSAESIPGGAHLSTIKVALAGEAGERAILQAAVRAVRQQSKVLAFAAAGGVVSRSWLRALVAPLSEAGVGASTGFRWYTPEPPAFWPLLRSVWSAVIAGRLGAGASEFVWEGAVAMEKDTFFDLRMYQRCDSFALIEAMQEAKRRIVFVPGGMVACPGGVTAGQFLRQARREMAQARRCLPGVWCRALAAHVVYCGAMLAAIGASLSGSRGAEWALVVLFGIGMLKGANRATLAKAELPHCKTWFDRYGWVHTFWVPLATWIWLGVLAASLFEMKKERTEGSVD